MSENRYERLGETISFLEQLAFRAREVVSEISVSELNVDKHIIFGDSENDVDLPVDIAIKEKIWNEIGGMSLRKPNVRYLFAEGSKPRLVDEAGNVDLYIDPLDGSLNHQKSPGLLGLPYSFVAYLMPVWASKISDVTASIIADLRCSDYYLACRDDDGIVISQMSSGDGLVDMNVDMSAVDIDGQHIYGGEFYYPENREIMMKISGNQKGWFRNPGSVAYEMASVASGQMAMFICCMQKQHELPAAYLMLKGAGGVSVTLHGYDLGDQPFDFDGKVSVGLFATEALKDEVLRRIYR